MQVVVPAPLRQQFLQYAHDNPLSGHLGRMKTLRRLLNVVYWPTIRKDTWDHCKQCQICQQYKPQITKLSGHLQSTPVVEPGYMLGIDFMGPFPKSLKQNEYLLVIVDYCSKWVELFPLRSAKAPLIAEILIREIFTCWGTPAYLVSDRGPQFNSQLINITCKKWGVTQKLTTSYHPQTNFTERINKTLKTMIASFLKENHRHWDRWIYEFRFAINSAWQESTAYTPAEIALGRKLKGPLERLAQRPPDLDKEAYDVIERTQALLERVRENVVRAQTRQERYYNWRRRHESFQTGDLVWVQAHPLSRADNAFMAKLAAKWRGPAKVIKQLNKVNYLVAMVDHPDQCDTYHVEKLKRFYGTVSPSTEKGGGCNSHHCSFVSLPPSH